MMAALRRLFAPKVVYVPSRRKSAHITYEQKKAETTARLKREMGRA